MQADWNESFELVDITKEIKGGRQLVLEAIDEDTLSNDVIGIS